LRRGAHGDAPSAEWDGEEYGRMDPAWRVLCRSCQRRERNPPRAAKARARIEWPMLTKSPVVPRESEINFPGFASQSRTDPPDGRVECGRSERCRSWGAESARWARWMTLSEAFPSRWSVSRASSAHKPSVVGSSLWRGDMLASR